MNVARAHASAPTVRSLEALSAAASLLEPPARSELKDLWRDAAAETVDPLLVRVARGRGALEVAIGEGLASLAEGDHTLRLGFACLGDYARERLGLGERTALGLARLARALRSRPLLREAVRSGEVSARKAETVLPLARGEDEAVWVARARMETVRALQVAVREAAGSDPDEDAEWERAVVSLSPGGKAKLDHAMSLAGKLLGASAPRWQRLEAICAEFLGAHPVAEDGAPARSDVRAPLPDGPNEVRAWLEEEHRHWEFLERIEPHPSPSPFAPDARTDPRQVDADLRRLAAMRSRWDEVFGHLAMLLRMCGLWRDMGFESFGHYCAERLGMAERTVAQRISLERRLYELPDLRVAMREGRLSYEKARVVARCADAGTVRAWIARAGRVPCIELRREAEALHEAEAQMCGRPVLDLRVPARVGSLLDEAFASARAVAGSWLSPGDCLEAIAAHFVETWEAALRERTSRRHRVLARDRGLCQVPGCSRAAAHVHHVRFRSAGGGDEPENLVSVCAAHHLHGVHLGWVRVRGRAPDRLRWELGHAPVGAAHAGGPALLH